MTDSPSAKPASSGALLRRLIANKVRPHLSLLLGSAFFMALTAAATGANAWLMKPAMNGVFNPSNPRLLWLIPLAVVVVAVIKGFASYGQSMLMSYVGQRIIADTQVELFSHLMRADLSWLHQMHSGKLVSSFLFDVTLLRDAVSRALTAMVKDSLTLVFLVGVMFSVDPLMALAVVFVFPAVALSVRNLGKKSRKGSTRTQEETGRLTAILNETFEGARLVKAYGREEYETDRARASVERRLRHIMKMVRARAATSPATEALGGVAVGLAIYYGGWRIAHGQMTPGDFGAFITALLMAYQPLKSLAGLNSVLQEGLAAAQRIFAVLDVRPLIHDAPDAKPLEIAGAEIRFEDVAFSYSAEIPALKGVSLTVRPGAKAALVGPSGAGKSTILNLIPRFFQPGQGRVLIDGQDIGGLTLASLRGAIALVSQEATLFDDTVRANLLYGRPGASEAEMIAAAEAAAAHEFIIELPHGYDTLIGENGLKLSGGQRQRLAIARAMLRNAPILLLDEATSALDAEAERKVQAALKRLMHGRTTLVIAHRLSTVIDADEIHVIEAGRVVESGRHQELLARHGVYARLYATQFGGENDLLSLTPPADRTAAQAAR